MTETCAGVLYGVLLSRLVPGSVYDVSPFLAEHLIQQGWAVALLASELALAIPVDGALVPDVVVTGVLVISAEETPSAPERRRGPRDRRRILRSPPDRRRTP